MTATKYAYTVGHDAWYADGRINPNPYLTVSSTNNGWEIDIVDMSARLAGQRGIQVQVFDDAFDAFTDATDLLGILAAQKPDSLTAVRLILDGMGAVDATQRVAPAAAERAARLRADAAQLLAEADRLDPGNGARP